METFNSPVAQLFSFFRELCENDYALLHMQRPKNKEEESVTNDVVLRIIGWNEGSDKTIRSYQVELDVWTHDSFGDEQTKEHFRYVDGIMDGIYNMDFIEGIKESNIHSARVISSEQYDTPQGERCLNSGIRVDVIMRVTQR